MSAQILDIPVRKITGADTTLGEFKGKVLLVVNVASKGGLTPQYEGLEKIYEQYKGQHQVEADGRREGFRIEGRFIQLGDFRPERHAARIGCGTSFEQRESVLAGSGLVELDMVGHVVAFGKGDCAVRGARNGQVDVPAIGFDALFAAPGAGAGFAHAALGLDVTRALQRGALWLLHARHGVRARCGVECIDSLVVAALVVSRAGRSAIAYAGGDLQIRVRGDGLAEQQQERKRQEARGHLHLQTNTMLASEIYEQSRCAFRNRLPGQGSSRPVLREAVGLEDGGNGTSHHDRYRRRGHWRPHYVAGPRAAPLHHVLCDGGRLAGCARQGARAGRQDAGASGGDSHGKLRMVCRSGRQYGRDFQAKVAGRPERPPQAGGLPHWQPGYCQFRMTLPDCPLDMTSKPCSNSV